MKLRTGRFTSSIRRLGTGSRRIFTGQGILLLAMLLKYTYYGLGYFPVLDDNNMYGVFSMMTPVDALVLNRWYTTRPVAGLLDAFVWSRLWDHQWVVLLTMTVLHFLGIVLLWKVFEENNLKAGVMAAVLFALLPFGTEAAYWVAASSRLVVGFFWACLSLYLLMLCIRRSEERNGRAAIHLAAFWLANLVSLGFYEQVIAFSFGGAVLALLKNFRRLRGLGGKLACAVPFVNLAAIGVWYRAFSHLGNVAARGQLVQGNYREHTIEVLRRIRGLLGTAQWEMFKNGTVGGLRLVVADRAYLYLSAVMVVSVLLAVLAARERWTGGQERMIPGGRPAADLRGNAAEFALGGVLLILPFAPFFLLDAAWIYNRNAFLSLLGLGLMVEALARTARVVLPGVLPGVLVGVLVFSSLLANTAGVADFRAVSLADREICQGFIRVAKTADPDWHKREIVLFNAQPLYAALHAEQLTNCTASDWAMMGAVQVAGRKLEIGHICPIPDGGQLVLSEKALKGALYLGIDDGMRTFPLSGTWKGGALELRRADGTLFGEASPRGGFPPRFGFSLARHRGPVGLVGFTQAFPERIANRVSE